MKLGVIIVTSAQHCGTSLVLKVHPFRLSYLEGNRLHTEVLTDLAKLERLPLSRCLRAMTEF